MLSDNHLPADARMPPAAGQRSLALAADNDSVRRGFYLNQHSSRAYF